jgi:hypothetical protein
MGWAQRTNKIAQSVAAGLLPKLPGNPASFKAQQDERRLARLFAGVDARKLAAAAPAMPEATPDSQ